MLKLPLLKLWSVCNAVMRRHFLVEYSDKPRQNVRTRSETELRNDMCYLFNARFVTFSNQQIDSVLNGDATID